jgi:hypothetical protein
MSRLTLRAESATSAVTGGGVETKTARLKFPQRGEDDVSLEAAIKENTETMRELITALGNGGGKPAAAAASSTPEKGKPGRPAKPKEDDTPKIDEGQIRALVNQIKEDHGTPAAKDFIKSQGASDLANLCTMKAKFPKIAAAAEAILAGGDDEGEDEGDDDL